MVQTASKHPFFCTCPACKPVQLRHDHGKGCMCLRCETGRQRGLGTVTCRSCSADVHPRPRLNRTLVLVLVVLGFLVPLLWLIAILYAATHAGTDCPKCGAMLRL